MTVYILTLLSILLIGLVYKNSRKRTYRKIQCFLNFLILFIVTSLKHYSGDLGNYIRGFKSIRDMGFPTFQYKSTESGYVFLNSIIGVFTDNEQVFMSIIGFIILLGFTLFIYKHSKDITLSFYLFITFDFFACSLNIYRQSIAIILILWSYEYIKKKKIIPFLSIIVIASLFHKTALVFIPMYFLSKIEISRKYIMFLICSMPLILYFGVEVIRYMLISIYPQYQYSEGSDTGGKYIIIFMVIIIIGFVFRKQYINKESNSLKKIINNKKMTISNIDLLYHMLITAIICQFLTYKIFIFSRITRYFSVFIIILIPEFLSGIKDKNMKRFITCGVLIGGFLLYMVALKVDVNSVVPYNFFWENK